MSVLPTLLFVLALVCLIGYNYWINSPQTKGKIGETMVHDILAQLPEEYHVMDDVVFSTGKGTTQIDHIVISKYGVFAIETKNYRGDIYGNDNRQEWTQIIVTNVTFAKKWWKTYTYVTKNKMYNPVKQAITHCNVIKGFLGDWRYLKVIPIVVFVGKANLDDVYTSHHVIYSNQLLSTIQQYKSIYLTDNDMLRIMEILTQKNVRELVDNKTHIRNVEKAKEKVNDKIASGICPKCGGSLVERTGRYGNFYGCSNYPKCKFTTN